MISEMNGQYNYQITDGNKFVYTNTNGKASRWSDRDNKRFQTSIMQIIHEEVEKEEIEQQDQQDDEEQMMIERCENVNLNSSYLSNNVSYAGRDIPSSHNMIKDFLGPKCFKNELSAQLYHSLNNSLLRSRAESSARKAELAERTGDLSILDPNRPSKIQWSFDWSQYPFYELGNYSNNPQVCELFIYLYFVHFIFLIISNI